MVRSLRQSLVGLFVSTGASPRDENGNSVAPGGRFTPPGSPQPRVRIKGKQKRAVEASPEFKVVLSRSREHSREGSATASPKRVPGDGDGDGGEASGGGGGLFAGVTSILHGAAAAAGAMVTSFDRGTLCVVAHEAQELPSVQLFGNMDPYVQGKIVRGGDGDGDGGGGDGDGDGGSASDGLAD